MDAPFEGSPTGIIRVLVADPSPQSRADLRQALERFGMGVLEATDGSQALRIASSQPPDLVLVDEALPGTSGAFFCEELRARPASKDIPVIVLCRAGDRNAITQAIEAGASDVMERPIDEAILCGRLRGWLEVVQGRARLARANGQLASLRRIARIATWEHRPDTDEFSGSEEIRSLFDLGFDGTPLTLELLLSRIHPADRDQLEGLFRKAGSSGEGFSVETRVEMTGGSDASGLMDRVLHWECEVDGGDSGRPLLVTGTLQDISRRRLDEQQIRYLAYHDGLTGLTNRNAFLERLDAALLSARRHRRKVALLFLDLDNFKRINDTLGHSAGDQLLQLVAERLTHCVRLTDCVGKPGEENSQVSRLGGDEFTVLLNEIANSEDAARVARRILDALREPFVLNRQEMMVGTSIGITVFPADGDDVDTLLHNADVAMYQAKEQGRSNYRFFSSSINEAETRRLNMERKLCRAFESHEIHIYYQPQIEIESGRICGVEALLRWEDPDLGAVSPAEFIPLAEDAHLIVPIGAWVLRTACWQMKAWREAGLPAMRLAVNLSPHQFERRVLVEMVAQTLWDTEMNGADLELEITENAFMRNQDEVVEILQEIKRLGVSVALDDFGTGYSSLSYLKRFPVNAVKIDRSFVRDIAIDSDDAAITDAIISMAKALRLRVVAEGVETDKQRAFLQKRGCDELQGYIVSPPVAADALEELLRRNAISPRG